MRHALMQTLVWGHQKSPCNLAYSLISVPDGGGGKKRNEKFLVSDQMAIIKTSFSVLMIMRGIVMSGVAPASQRPRLRWLERPRHVRHFLAQHIIHGTRAPCRWGGCHSGMTLRIHHPARWHPAASSQFLSNINHHHPPWLTNSLAVFCSCHFGYICYVQTRPAINKLSSLLINLLTFCLDFSF